MSSHALHQAAPKLFVVLLVALFLAQGLSTVGEPTLAPKTTAIASAPAVTPTQKTASDDANVPLRILVVGGHPADVFDQSGGTMAHHIARGDHVSCVVMTTGVRTHDKVIVDDIEKRKSVPDAEKLNALMHERSKVKEAEVIKACGILGVKRNDIYFLGADDAVAIVREELIRKVARLIRSTRPDVVITHYPFENGGLGSMHPVTGQMVLHAIDLGASVEPGDSNPPHKVTQVFFFGQGSAAVRTGLWDSQGGYYNDVFVDISDVAEKKLACLDAMESQGYGGPYARKRIETVDGAFGNKMGMAYAEGFISLHSTSHYYLPVPQMDLERSRRSNHEDILHRSHRINVP